MSNGKIIIILLITEVIRKIPLYKMSYFSESDTHSKKKKNENKIRFA